MRRLLFLAMAALMAMVSTPAVVAQTDFASSDLLQANMVGLVDQNGHPITRRQLDAKNVIVNFIFTGCGSTCPLQTAALVRFFRSLSPEMRSRLVMISVSVDPANDTPARMKAFAHGFGADSRNWIFATGTPSQIARVTRTFATFRPGGAANSGFHTTDVRLFDARHRMIQRYTGAPLPEARLRDDLATLIRLNRA